MASDSPCCRREPARATSSCRARKVTLATRTSAVLGQRREPGCPRSIGTTRSSEEVSADPQAAGRSVSTSSLDLAGVPLLDIESLAADPH